MGNIICRLNLKEGKNRRLTRKELKMNFPKFVKLSIGCLLALYGILMFVVTLKYDGMVCNYPGPVGMHQLLKIEGGLLCGIAVLLISTTLIERSKNECLVALRTLFVWW